MIVADHRFAFPVPNVEWIVMSDMDETNDAIDSQGDEVSASAYEMPARETAASHSKTVQNDSQNSREFPEEDPVESNCAMDKEAAQDSSEERHEDEAVEDEYEDESEDGDQEEDEVSFSVEKYFDFYCLHVPSSVMLVQTMKMQEH